MSPACLGMVTEKLIIFIQCQLCSETFLKSHFLRDHITLAHLASGTKPYRCPFEGCTWSFALKQHLRAHEKTHDRSFLPVPSPVLPFRL